MTLSYKDQQPLKFILEIDRMEGTEVPPSITTDNQTYDITSIFQNTGLEIIPTIEEKLIPTSGIELFSDAVLEKFMKSFSNRHKNIDGKIANTDLFAYLLIVNGISARGSTVLGVMFDGKKREGTAVFYGNPTIRNDPYFYLRTTVHELGHQFNLHHEDATSNIISDKRKFSIMNQTRTIMNSPESNQDNPSENIGYFFGDLEIKHLIEHPREHVKPGGNLD
jgi:hypothetical protein